MATGRQLNLDGFFLIVDSCVVLIGVDAIYALNALFCAHWAFNVECFSHLQPFYNFLEVINFGKNPMCSVRSLLAALDAKSSSQLCSESLFRLFLYRWIILRCCYFSFFEVPIGPLMLIRFLVCFRQLPLR